MKCKMVMYYYNNIASAYTNESRLYYYKSCTNKRSFQFLSLSFQVMPAVDRDPPSFVPLSFYAIARKNFIRSMLILIYPMCNQ